MGKKEFKTKEKKLSEIYHPFWNEFNKKQYSEATSLFAGRLKANGFDLNWFKDKVCLDAGCGSGRYVQAMLDLEAKEIVGIDLDPAVAKKNIYNPKAKVMEGDIREIPFPDSYFDFICCNGVLHHLENPPEVIKELSRVLKKGGYLFLYVFDPFTDDWEVIDEFRKAAQKFLVERTKKFIKGYLDPPENKLFNFFDVLYAPIQIKFTKEELNRLLKDYEIRYFDVPFTDYDKKEENRLIARKIK